ncbi:GtrA family protein [Microvirga pudoricolor]|uniref:GtrA family protein n=1 Tax=Microvirga pudoricolor TaxID=2778729 RepID=UPI0019521111|nr:GtrA family protein [Microvirga pudoricolor]MBM6594326.1 GtrA family protein [Microvirga pudoricolor]
MKRYAPLAKQLVKFAVIGGCNTLLTLSIIVGLSHGFGVSPYAANAVGYVCGLALSYVLNRAWTFRSHSDHRRSVPLFLLVFAVAYLANLATLAGLMPGLGEVAAQVAGAVVYTAVFFIGSRTIAFRDRAPASG